MAPSTHLSSKQTQEILTILSLCFLWYLVSSSNNVVGKMLLSEFPFPMTVTMVQLLSITVYSGPFFKLWGVRRFFDVDWRYYFKFLVPLALGKFIASVFTHISIWKVPISFAHTVKATMPLFTVVLSRIILGEKQTYKVYLSLVPIIVGVAVATLTELSFDITGLVSALLATMQHSLQNIFSKKVLKDTGVHHLRLLYILGRLSLLLFTPVWLYFDFFRLLREPVFGSPGRFYVMSLLITDGVLNWLQNILAFSVMSLVTSLTYAVASASKRVFVIGASLFILGNPVTSTNLFGMALAIFGVLAYNKAKFDARQEGTKPILPTYDSRHYSPLTSNGHLPKVVNNNDRISNLV